MRLPAISALAKPATTAPAAAADTGPRNPPPKPKNTSTDLYLYGPIGDWGTSAADLVPTILEMTGPITLHINSPGGDVWDGVAIYNTLINHPSDITIIVDGVCASAATIIAMAGDVIIMSPGSRLMIHQASSWLSGNADEHRYLAELLDTYDKDIAAVYAARTGKPATTWLEAMRKETWYTAQEAVDAGLATTIGATGPTPTEPEPEPETEPAMISTPPGVMALAAAEANPPANAESAAAQIRKALKI